MSEYVPVHLPEETSWHGKESWKKETKASNPDKRKERRWLRRLKLNCFCSKVSSMLLLLSYLRVNGACDDSCCHSNAVYTLWFHFLICSQATACLLINCIFICYFIFIHSPTFLKAEKDYFSVYCYYFSCQLGTSVIEMCERKLVLEDSAL